MLIGLATPYQTNNYGTKLQALALQKTVSDLGYENEIIRYEFGDKGGKVKKLLLGGHYKRWKKARTVRKKIELSPEIGKGLGMRNRAFREFTECGYTLSAPCKHLDDVRTLCSRYAAVVCGSDQIWLPSHILLNYYTLNFVPQGVKRVAYAPSFGVGRLPAWLWKDYGEFIQKLDTVTAREEQGAELVERLLGKPCPLVLDPTLLLTTGQWEELIKEVPPLMKQRYVLMYYIGNQEGYRLAAKEYAAAKHCRLVTLPHISTVNPSDDFYADDCLYDISPLQFLRLIHDAEGVFTDSFHGSVFSMIFHREFYTLERFHQKDASSTNGRVYSLLRMADLENRILRSESHPPMNAAPIQYEDVDHKIDAARKRSLQILSGALPRRMPDERFGP